MARSEGAEGPEQHLADAIAAAFARTEQPGEHLAVHAPKLAIEPRLQILRRHRRSLLLRLEHPYCSAVEDHVNRAPGVGLHRSFNLRIGINLHSPLQEARSPRVRDTACAKQPYFHCAAQNGRPLTAARLMTTYPPMPAAGAFSPK